MKSFTLLMLSILISNLTFSQSYEIKFDTLNASGWFGGDNRPGQQRNVAVAQSVFIEEPITLESFAFFFTTHFDSAANPTGTGHEVLLKLHIRDSLGTILRTEQVIVPDTFNGGWVTWSNINLALNETGKYIFSSYLVGGYDTNQVNSSQGCDQFAGYPGGERYVKYVTNDAEAEMWGDWSQHSWDSDFWLTGNLNPSSVEYSEVINEFALSQNYPNPFNPSTTISWQAPVGSHQTLKVYDVLGNEVAILVDEYKPAGRYEVEFSAKGGSASGGDAYNLSSGIYLYQLQAAGYTQTKKLVLLK